MKYVIFLGDGMADVPVPELGGKTPLEAARHPGMDRMAQYGAFGMVRTVPEGMSPGSDTANLSEVIVYKRKRLLRKDAAISLYGNRIVIDEGRPDELALLFDSIDALSVLGRNKLNIYHGEKLYQLKSGKRFNALKYVNIYYRHKNVSRGDNDGKFLGL